MGGGLEIVSLEGNAHGMILQLYLIFKMIHQKTSTQSYVIQTAIVDTVMAFPNKTTKKRFLIQVYLVK